MSVHLPPQKIIEVTKVSDVTTLKRRCRQKTGYPRTTRNIAIGILVGGMSAVILVLIFEVLDDRVKRPQDIEEVMGLTLLGVVPDSKKLK